MDEITFRAIFYGSGALGVGLWTVLYRRELGFLNRTPEIRNHGDLVELRRMVKEQMYSVLPLTILGFTPFVLALSVWFLDLPFTWVESVATAVLVAYYAHVTVSAKALEAQIIGMPVATEHLQKQVDETIQIWRKRLFPTW